MRQLALIIGALLLLQPQIAMSDELEKPIDVRKYSGYLGYFLRSLSYAKKLHPDLAVPYLSEIKLGYNLLRGSDSIVKAAKGDVEEGIVRTPIEKLSDIGLVAVKAGAAVVGYTLPYTYASYILSGSSITTAYLPTLYEIFSASLPGLKESYPLGEFHDKDKQQTTYLACSYTDPQAPKKSFKIWADEKLIGTDNDLEDYLKFYKNTVLITGRWVLNTADGKKYYSFGTTADPLLLQSACYEAIASYAKEQQIELGATGQIKISSGNTVLANSYPVRFYHPVVLKAAKWSKQKPLFNRKALLLVEQPKK